MAVLSTEEKKKDDKYSEGFTESTMPKNPDGTLKMTTFYELLPKGRYRDEMLRYADLDVLFGKLKYNRHFNSSPENEFLRGSYSEKKHTFQASPLTIVWGDDSEEDHISAYRIIMLLIISHYVMTIHRSCEEAPQPAYIMTDIHGQFSDMLRWFFKIGGPEQCAYNYVCTGDMVDRGLHQIETVCLFLYYKVRYPSRVFLLRGNHEDFDLHETYGFLSECNDRFSKLAEDDEHKRLSRNMWYMFIHVFDYMPTVCIVERKFMCVHGGISPLLSYCMTCKANHEKPKILEICTQHRANFSVDQLISIVNNRVRTPLQVGRNYVQPGDVAKIYGKLSDPDRYLSLFSDLIWSDPKTCDGRVGPTDSAWLSLRGWSENKQRQISFEFGTDVIEKFISQYSISTIIRGHEPKVLGYEWHYRKRCITVFSAPNYSKNNDAAIAMVTEKDDSNSRRLRLDPIMLSKIG